MRIEKAKDNKKKEQKKCRTKDENEEKSEFLKIFISFYPSSVV